MNGPGMLGSSVTFDCRAVMKETCDLGDASVRPGLYLRQWEVGEGGEDRLAPLGKGLQGSLEGFFFICLKFAKQAALDARVGLEGKGGERWPCMRLGGAW